MLLFIPQQEAMESFAFPEVLKKKEKVYKPGFAANWHFKHQVKRSAVKCQEIVSFPAVTGRM